MFDTLATDIKVGDIIVLSNDPDPCEVLGVNIKSNRVDVYIFDVDISSNSLVVLKLDDKVEVLKRNDSN